MEKDALMGSGVVFCFAMIAAWTGDKELGLSTTCRLIRLSSRLTYGDLKLMPFWDPLRREPCFEKILASLAPK